MLPAVDPDRVRALAPPLDQVAGDVTAGAWDRAAQALSAWRTTADALHAETERVARANAAPVARRNELRGQLQVFRAKSLALGHGEQAGLDDLHEQAQKVVHVAPCDLARAEALVRDYITAVNAAGPGGRR